MTKFSGRIDQATHLPSVQMEFDRASNTCVKYMYIFLDLNAWKSVDIDFSCYVVLSSEVFYVQKMTMNSGLNMGDLKWVTNEGLCT